METEKKMDEASNTHSQESNGHSPQSVTPENISTEPAPGRKMSREEAMDYVFKKNEGLLRRLA